MSSVTSVSNPISPISERLADLTVEAMRGIVRDSFERLAQGKPSKEALKGGIWLTTDYIRAYRAFQFSPEEKKSLPPESALSEVRRGYAPETHFDRPQNRPMRFVSKPNVQPSEALAAAIKGPVLTDCGGACQIAMHKALCDLLGNEVYDKQFKGALIIGQVARDPLFGQFLKLVDAVDKAGQKTFSMSRGKFTSIANHPDYPRKHRFGPHAAYNLIYGGQGKYLGLGLPPEGMTAVQARDFLVEEFNKPPSTNLGGLVGQAEYEIGMLGLELQGQKPIKENVQIAPRDVPATMDPGLTFEYKLEALEKLVVPLRD